MNEKELNEMAEELQDDEVYTYTLTDEEGQEYEFMLLGTCEDGGHTYYALAPLPEEGKEQPEEDEYIILRGDEIEGEVQLVTIDDDDEFDRVADLFDTELFGEVDHDAE